MTHAGWVHVFFTRASESETSFHPLTKEHLMRFTHTAFALGLALAGAFTLPASAAKPGSQIITITTAVGSGHTYDGVLDVCNGKFSATGTTTAGSVTYQEVVNGTVTPTTLTYTSTYVGEVDDGTGTWDPYSYRVNATVSGTTFTGTYLVTKTDADDDSVTLTESGPIIGTVTYGGALVGDQFKNHGQCIRSFTH
jgi:hypothetical protein